MACSLKITSKPGWLPEEAWASRRGASNGSRLRRGRQV